MPLAPTGQQARQVVPRGLLGPFHVRPLEDATFPQGAQRLPPPLGEGRIFHGADMERSEQAARDNLARLLADWMARAPEQGVIRPA